MIYDIRHVTTYRYDAPVTSARCTLRLLPSDDEGQRVFDSGLEVSPAPATISERQRREAGPAGHADGDLRQGLGARQMGQGERAGGAGDEAAAEHGRRNLRRRRGEPIGDAGRRKDVLRRSKPRPSPQISGPGVALLPKGRLSCSASSSFAASRAAGGCSQQALMLASVRSSDIRMPRSTLPCSARIRSATSGLVVIVRLRSTMDPAPEAVTASMPW
jgi:hypothetical protein